MNEKQGLFTQIEAMVDAMESSLNQLERNNKELRQTIGGLESLYKSKGFTDGEAGGAAL
jgi:prefoldin subunit 5